MGKRKGKFAEDHDDAIRAGYAAGERVGNIADRLHRSTLSVIGRAHRMGLRHNSPFGRRLSAAKREAADVEN